MKTCKLCKYFRGCGDWGLCCDLKYDLCYEDSEACDKYEARDKYEAKEKAPAEMELQQGASKKSTSKE